MTMLAKRVIASVALALLLVSGTVAAHGVEATATAPLVLEGDIEIQLWMGANPGEAVTIVSLVIPDSVELPATVRLPLIEGTSVDWAGEISGGDPASDPPRKFKIVDGPSGGRFAEFTVEQYRVAQIDLSPTPHVEQGDKVSAQFDYIEPLGSSDVAFSVRLPAVASKVQITPKPEGKPGTNEIGESLHKLAPVSLKVGEKASVDVAYVMDLGKIDGGSGTDPFGIVIGVLAALAAVVLVVVMVVASRGRRRADVADESGEES